MIYIVARVFKNHETQTEHADVESYTDYDVALKAFHNKCAANVESASVESFAITLFNDSWNVMKSERHTKTYTTEETAES